MDKERGVHGVDLVVYGFVESGGINRRERENRGGAVG